MYSLQNRLCLITGASSGIGAATALAAGRAGARVIILARSKDKLDQVAGQIVQGGTAAFVYPVDLSDDAATSRVCRRIIAEVGIPDILVNNAGIGRWRYCEETNPAEAASIARLPYLAAFGMTHYFLPGMLARNQGQIINVTSPASFTVWPGATAYMAARWALRGFTRALQADLRHTNIQVTLFTAGEVSSSYWKNNPGSRERVPGISRILPRYTPEQVAQHLLRAMEKRPAHYVTGQTYRLVFWFQRLFPNLVDHIVWRTGHSRPAKPV